MTSIPINPFAFMGIPENERFLVRIEIEHQKEELHTKRINECLALMVDFCDKAKITPEELRQTKSSAKYSDFRKIFSHFLHKKKNLTHKEIAYILERERSSISYAIKTTDDLLFSDKKFKNLYQYFFPCQS